ncbi:hypothetical protein GALMADRAFT_137713 [Galerina marginata CBS 339.88]|uniref:Uncharacterized protein n=1 Tax=Galerina marginata (strain CBS 339.88) TaxID=685588 RepID=A0A067T669_GALM3|nr:hypothetical protein GALMADRAFT_137713 [Galerina marginata CBS 339.88]
MSTHGSTQRPTVTGLFFSFDDERDKLVDVPYYHDKLDIELIMPGGAPIVMARLSNNAQQFVVFSQCSPTKVNRCLLSMGLRSKHQYFVSMVDQTGNHKSLDNPQDAVTAHVAVLMRAIIHQVADNVGVIRARYAMGAEVKNVEEGRSMLIICSSSIVCVVLAVTLFHVFAILSKSSTSISTL